MDALLPAALLIWFALLGSILAFNLWWASDRLADFYRRSWLAWIPGQTSSVVWRGTGVFLLVLVGLALIGIAFGRPAR